MYKKILISIIVFYLLVLVQTSFLVHFTIFDAVPNIVLILVVAWNLLEKRKNYLGIINALIGGFFLDIFSNHFIGFYVLILVGLAIFIKLIFKRYVQIPFIDKI